VASIGLRLYPDLEKSINDWRRGQDDRPSIPEAIRRLVEMSLANAKPAKAHSKKSTAKATEMAGREIDRLSDQSVPVEEREGRKRRLIKGPREFRDIRSDLPKPKR
jgi:hypothetical protein